MTLARSISSVAMLAVIFGCAAQKSAESPAAAPARTEATPQPSMDAEGASAPAGAPAKAAAPAPAAEMPRSTSREGSRTEQGDELDLLGRKLDGALALSAPDCTSAWALRDRICDLAQRLCDLAARSAEPEMAERCSDGRGRCERATSRVRASCSD